MNYKVELAPAFIKGAKQLAKKYTSLKTDLAKLFVELEANPVQGIPLGHDIYKIRLSIASKGKGKSGGARIITFVRVIQSSVILLTIYNKSEKANISDKEIKELLKEYL